MNMVMTVKMRRFTPIKSDKFIVLCSKGTSNVLRQQGIEQKSVITGPPEEAHQQLMTCPHLRFDGGRKWFSEIDMQTYRQVAGQSE
jgi:hypothetical protein